MKPLLLSLLVLAFAIPLRADNWLTNGDFSDGINNWRGNGEAPADVAPENPLDPPNPLFAKGLILPLRDADWDTIAQDFHGKSTKGVLTITYMLTPDVAFSDKPDDYTDVPDKIHLEGWKPFTIPPGTWIAFIADFGSAHGEYYKIKPKLGVSGPQTLTAKVDKLTPLEDKTITIAFPPGTGTVVILGVSLTDQ
jgi:hypothetical protein